MSLFPSIDRFSPSRAETLAAPPRRSPLAQRLIRVMFGCYLAVAVALTAIQMGLEYRSASEALTANVVALQRTFSPGLADAMWRFNTEVVEGILSGMREIPILTGVEVRDEAGQRVRAFGSALADPGTPPDGALGTALASLFDAPFQRTFELTHVDENGAHHAIGSWTVYSNHALVLDQLKRTVVIILINSAIKSLMLLVIFYVVIQRMVGRPLAEMSAFVQEIDADNLGTRPLVVAAGGRHELHALASTLNRMARRLGHAFEENARLLDNMRDLTSTLQAKVGERTQELKLLAETDLLTGLANRRKLDEELGREIAFTGRARVPLSIILGDIDRFKSINDRHGHKAGDKVLAIFAEVLRDRQRPADTIGRWGGEEFMLICPGSALEPAVEFAEAIRSAIEATSFPVAGRQTCSFGVATLQPGETADELVARADAALYAGKRNGRNRVEASRPGGSA
ncbi:hypothetical protein GCM10011390_12710 [Aureimonas endophytica]|uniref:diguanylate cyclase n=1 Tax=Aureimonas endophytica TaxID=2027858 RepID=A0A916ZH35_9HYPH|nr:GGDEF domain-containing protein [Aureimonas endophytica]GGD95428.1 hypothetical protein GCM10011390_12710 [Aureimonas endophytica]